MIQRGPTDKSFLEKSAPTKKKSKSLRLEYDKCGFSTISMEMLFYRVALRYDSRFLASLKVM